MRGRSGKGRWGGVGKLEPIEVADRGAGAVGIEDNSHVMNAGGEVDAGLGDRLPVLPAARGRHGHGAGDVLPVHLQVESSAQGIAVGDAEVGAERAGLGEIHGIAQPFAGGRPADVVSAARVGAGLEVHAFGGAIFAAVVGFVQVVVRDSFAALIVVFDLDGRAIGCGRTPVCRALGSVGGGAPGREDDVPAGQSAP